MGDWRYVGLSIVISFIGPFYFLEEKIYHFNEAERIARETCISFNQEIGFAPENIDHGYYGHFGRNLKMWTRK